MKTNWNKIVEDAQAKRHVLPEGWSDRESVAEQIGCAPDNVRKMLNSAISLGIVECKVLGVWDSNLKRVRQVMCYREINAASPEPTPAKEGGQPWTADMVARGKALRASGKSWSQIAAVLGKTRASVKHKIMRAKA